MLEYSFAAGQGPSATGRISIQTTDAVLASLHAEVVEDRAVVVHGRFSIHRTQDGKLRKVITNSRVADCKIRIEDFNAMNATTTKQRQSFSFKAPTAHVVLLAGDFTRWLKHPISLHKQVDGVWTTTTSLTPGTYHYRFLVDGEWQDDPDCKLRVKNPFGTLNDVIQVSSNPQVTTTKTASPAS